MKKKRRWVVKAGSEMVCSGGPLLVRAWMNQVAQLRKRHNIEVIWVTSGAIASAMDRTSFPRRKRNLPEKQALSAIGQPMVMDLYNLALHAAGLLGAQVLLTAGDTRDPSRRRNLQNTLNKILEWKSVPILNENDAVATEEIQFGDNDSLSSLIAQMMGAERLVLLTDVDGLFDSDPKRNPDAQLIPYLRRVGKKDFLLADRKNKSARGTGGMLSKLLATDHAARRGIVTHLVRGDWPQNLLLLAAGQAIGTQIGG
ncbi:MAG: glutamate 5-kinase [Bdellovibrionota bacterium]